MTDKTFTVTDTHTPDEHVSVTSPETVGDKIAGAVNSVMPGDERDGKAHGTAHKPEYVLTIDEGVVEKISSLAAQRVDGIVDMKGSVFSMIQEGFGGSDDKKGVDADVSDGTATVELSIILEYGKSALKVFDEIKDAVAGQVHDMTGLEVTKLTVNVTDVADATEYNKRREGTPEPEKRTPVTLAQ